MFKSKNEEAAAPVHDEPYEGQKWEYKQLSSVMKGRRSPTSTPLVSRAGSLSPSPTCSSRACLSSTSSARSRPAREIHLGHPDRVDLLELTRGAF